MDYSKVTLQDCIDMMEKKDLKAIVNDGQITRFEKDEITLIWGDKQWRRI